MTSELAGAQVERRQGQGTGLRARLDDATAVRFLEESKGLLCVVTVDGDITWVNHCWKDELGWSDEEIATRPFTEFLHRDERRQFSAAMLYAAETGEAMSIGCRTETSAGDVIWVSWHVALLDDGMLAVAGRSIDDVVKARVRALEQSKFLRSILDSIDASIAIVDGEGLIVGTNAQWARPTEVSGCGVGAPVGANYLELCNLASEDELHGHSWAEEAPLVAAAVAAILAGERADATVEYADWRPDGQEWFQARASALRLGDGRRGCVVAHIDITSRVLAEREAAERTVEAELLSLVARHTHNAVVITDSAGRVRWVNEAFGRLTGYQLEEVRGKTAPRMSAAEGVDPEVLAAIETGIGEGTGYQVELPGRSKAGDDYWVDVEARPIRNEDGHLEGFITVQSDITARKEMERRLREERALLHDIMAAVPFSMFWKNRESRFLGCNAAMAISAGLVNTTDIVGLSDADLPWYEHAGEYQADDEEIMDRGESRLHVQGKVLQADGSTHHILSSKVPMRNASGEVEGLIGVFVDVTEQRALEAQLANANKLESIGQLAAGVAHEINTPTQYVGDNLHFLKQSMADLSPLLTAGRDLARSVVDGTVTMEKAAAFLAEVDDVDADYLAEEMPEAIEQSLSGVERISRIVGAMKEFSHPGLNAMSPVDINRAVASSITVTTNEWKYVAEVVSDLDDDLPLVPGIPGELSQVFVNMIVNSAHAIAESVADRPDERGTITISTRLDGDHAEIRIGDNGAGIPEEVQGRVFDHFFTTKQVGRGTGQGLSLAHGVVNKHNGSVTFETEAGVGTTFIVRIPLQQGPRSLPI